MFQAHNPDKSVRTESGITKIVAKSLPFVSLCSLDLLLFFFFLPHHSRRKEWKILKDISCSVGLR